MNKNKEMYDSQYWIEGRIVINAYAKDIVDLRARLLAMVHDLDKKMTGGLESGGVLIDKWLELSAEQDGDPVHGLVFDEATDHGESGKDSMSMIVRHCDNYYSYE